MLSAERRAFDAQLRFTALNVTCTLQYCITQPVDFDFWLFGGIGIENDTVHRRASMAFLFIAYTL
jgi:hypothetical protein